MKRESSAVGQQPKDSPRDCSWRSARPFGEPRGQQDMPGGGVCSPSCKAARGCWRDWPSLVRGRGWLARVAWLSRSERSPPESPSSCHSGSRCWGEEKGGGAAWWAGRCCWPGPDSAAGAEGSLPAQKLGAAQPCQHSLPAAPWQLAVPPHGLPGGRAYPSPPARGCLSPYPWSLDRAGLCRQQVVPLSAGGTLLLSPIRLLVEAAPGPASKGRCDGSMPPLLQAPGLCAWPRCRCGGGPD